MMQIVEVAKLSLSQAGITAAYRASIPLLEADWMRYPAPTWDAPAILGLTDGLCVAGINYSISADTNTARVDFAWCSSEHPAALVPLLSRFRATARTAAWDHVAFTCHAGNEAMAKAVRVLGLEPHSMTYRMPISAFALRV